EIKPNRAIPNVFEIQDIWIRLLSIERLHTIPDNIGRQNRTPGERTLDYMEYFFPCPYCWQRISMVLDLSVHSQIYVEDCEVCCRPIQIRYVAQDDEIVEFEAEVLE